MEAAHEFLTTLALVLCVAGITTVLFQRLHQPVVFGYLLAGLIIGPGTPIPLEADPNVVQTLAELGVILLMFSLGLEFSLRKLIKVAPTAGVIALGQASAMMWAGYLIGQLFGWTTLESVYLGAIIAISSTTIIIKAFNEQGIRERFTRLVFGILIVEDLIGILLLTILTAISAGAVSFGSLAATAGRLGLFLALLIGIGLLIVPRVVRMVVRLDKPETTLVMSVGVCFALSWLALSFGYSVALGAFIAGSLIAESGHAKSIEHLVQPVRDMFGAIFFVAVGMLIDPRLIGEHIGAVIVITLTVIVVKVTSVTVLSFVTGYNVRTSVQTGMSLAQIGEFSFIIAGLGLSLGATRDFLYPIAVAVSAITTLTTPILIRKSGRFASWLDRNLPHPIQNFVSLYTSWIEGLRTREPVQPGRKQRRIVLLLILDAILLAALTIGVSLELGASIAALTRITNLTPEAAMWVTIAGAFLIAIPLGVGIFRGARSVGLELANRVFPPGEPGKVDTAAAPRRAMAITLHISIVFIIGAPLVAITQPFLPLFRGALPLIAVLALLAIAFWRSARNLEGHTRAGAEIIVMALSRQMAEEETESAEEARAEAVRRSLPGLGEPVPIRLHSDSPAVGKSLADLDLRGSTGATVLAILRENGEDVTLPTGRETLHAGDTLMVAGSHKAIAGARIRLTPPKPPHTARHISDSSLTTP